MKVDPETSGASKAQDDTCKKGTPQEEAGVGISTEFPQPVGRGRRGGRDAQINVGKIRGWNNRAGLRRDLDGSSEQRIEFDFVLFAIPIFTGALARILRTIVRHEDRGGTKINAAGMIEANAQALAAKKQQGEQNATDHGFSHGGCSEKKCPMSNRIV